MLTIDGISFAIGVGCGFIVYLFTAMAIALWVSKKWKDEVNYNDNLYEKKLKECGYIEDIFE